MPDDVAEIPAVDLVGASMLALVEAIPEFEARTGRRASVIGGLAVLCRLGTVYRATGDLDTANRRAAGEPPQLDVLLQHDDVTQADTAGVWIPTSAGAVKVDVIEVSDAELSHLPEDETDRPGTASTRWQRASARGTAGTRQPSAAAGRRRTPPRPRPGHARGTRCRHQRRTRAMPGSRSCKHALMHVRAPLGASAVLIGFDHRPAFVSTRLILFRYRDKRSARTVMSLSSEPPVLLLLIP